MQNSINSVFRVVGAVWLIAMGAAMADPISARPQYLAAFQADPFRRAEVDGCGTCHVNTGGGGARNDFGAAFDAASREITPLLRANFPQQFKFESAKLPDGTVFALSDPASKFVVMERQNQKVLVDVASLTVPTTAPLPPAETRMSFFVTSTGIDPGQIGGLAGADRYCQTLSETVAAGDRTWRAYLSTSFDGKPAVNAGDRIGSGPWYNAKGRLVARGPVDLHAKSHLTAEVLYTEKGEPVVRGDRADAAPGFLTGSLANGTAAVGKSCSNWTSLADGEAMVGDAWTSWNAARPISCLPGPGPAPKPRLYCFVLR
ncbi:MAG TPA: hypothetical protein VNJ02_20135 [Vicinamibacterales bacterium]|nr:hypothetical protein [Vicinamibacterales bacterium]